MHAKTDSEVTSVAPSSPTRSPHRPVYYVQSPSRDSHEGEKTTTSFHSTPVLSPAGSPPHSHSSVGHHSRESSTSRFSGSLRPGSRKISPNDGEGRGGRRKGGDNKAWKAPVIEEEGLLEYERKEKGLPRAFYLGAFVLAFFVLFFFFALVLWGASHNQKPVVTMKSITFENFVIQAGTDASNVPTDLETLNSTVKLTFRNTGSFFGVHVSSTPIVLSYYQLTMATGNIDSFYQRRKSQRSLSVVVAADQIPLYGGGSSLSSMPAMGKPSSVEVPLNLTFRVRSRAYVLGQLVKPKFYSSVQCSVTLVQAKLNSPVTLNNCQYS